jgi:hypothetical protein
MSDDEQSITPQVPGDPPNVDPAETAPLLDEALVDLVATVPDLSDLDLAALEATERNGENREHYLEAIAAEQLRREDAVDQGDGDPQGDQPPPADIGPPPAVDEAAVEHARRVSEDARYRNMRAADIDQAKLTRKVLTRDGWLLPLPRAEGA